MSLTGPTDKLFTVPDGTLRVHPNRDARFPYLYQVHGHPLVRADPAIQQVFVFVIDTSPLALKALLDFEDSLTVPLGPDASMEDLGLFELHDGTVVFIRERGCENPEDDVLFAWNYLGWVAFKPEIFLSLNCMMQIESVQW
ncbi:hypothetical protein CPB83DRAFT_776472 [Crepidotus variabilis]|uniref:Uncharacterized protein n=1 Tax=Crepidotus variabilis TaxID=179855 RepID=A0A9P6E5F3_9AGAR|nr:hypothetical protein CPB83DRAFT_776472 [Crepidotus variabilis]